MVKTFENKEILLKEESVQALAENIEKTKALQKEDEDLIFIKSLLENRKERINETPIEKKGQEKDSATEPNNEEQNVEEIKYEVNQEESREPQLQEETTEKDKYDYEEMYMKTFGTKPYKKIEQNNVSIFENIENYKVREYKIVGIVFKTYIVIEMEEEMYIIDQHAAHERIMYEKIKKNYCSGGEKESQ